MHVGRRSSLPMSVVELIVADHHAGQSLAGIARRLNAQGVATAHGGAQWHASTVLAVLASTAAQQLIPGMPVA